VDDIIGQLQRIVEAEKLTAEPEALMLIARQAVGGMRDAISLLDQMASTGQEITLGLTQTVLGTATSQTVLTLVGAVLDRQPAAGMQAIHAALDSGTDPRLLARQVVDYLRALLLLQMGNTAQVDLAAETRPQAGKHAKAFSSAEVLRMIKAFNAAAVDLRGGWQPSLPLELALAEVLEAPPAALSSPGASGIQAKKVEPVPPKKVSAEARGGEPSAKTADQNGTARAPSEESNVTLDQVAKAWKQIGATVKSNMSLKALLNSCKLLELKNATLVLGFASDILRDKVNTPEQIATIRRAITEVLGIDLKVKCIVSNAKQTAPSDVKSDGMVAAALKHGGEIVDIQ
jgi:DNA polymerase-3 subunit gamma/tau